MDCTHLHRFEQLQAGKPHEQLKDATPEIRDYVLALEKQLEDVLHLESQNNEINGKYLEVQEDQFALHLQIVQYKEQIEELKRENVKLMKACEKHTKRERNEMIRPQPAPVCTLQLAREEIVDANENNANSILVKGAPLQLFAAGRKMGIMSIGKKMDLQLVESDIRKITAKERNFYKRQNMEPDKSIFIVELYHPDTKVNILKNKEKLKTYEAMKNIEITDYVSEVTFNLYQYAKVLKSCGYHLVYWRNNSVYAKKTRSSNSQPILIESTNQVDVLKQIK